MELSLRRLSLTKRYPLTISRGTAASSENLIVTVSHDGIAGFGEFSPVSQATPPENVNTSLADLTRFDSLLEGIVPWEFQRIEALAAEDGIGRAAYCALDMALHDWLGKRLQTPIYLLLGGDKTRIVPSSLTIGINPPDVVRERVDDLMARLNPKSLKIKLGSPDGLEADRAMFQAVKERAPSHVALRVDANGGWRTIEDARTMMRWLADLGVEYVEQPLAHGREDELPALFKDRPLPIYADESCRIAADVPKLADRVDGVNLKLLKAGGIREGLRLIHTARAHGLSVMMGCMSEASLAISASVALSPYADHLDLDSHLNILNDPFQGLTWQEGCVLPSDEPGLGIHFPREAE